LGAVVVDAFSAHACVSLSTMLRMVPLSLAGEE
jgi:hypothetical protein